MGQADDLASPALVPDAGAISTAPDSIITYLAAAGHSLNRGLESAHAVIMLDTGPGLPDRRLLIGNDRAGP